ncbi:MAG: hypothetical protein ACPG6U_04760 [Paracoccaceae bacterium]
MAYSYYERDFKMAGEYTRRLKILEPDFHPSSLLDPSYPVAILRQAGVIDRIGEVLG